jgi:lipoyl(octanoyl) transferase
LNPLVFRREFLRVDIAAFQKIPRLALWDGGVADGGSHMAIDEALLRTADGPVLRWYRWQRAEVTFGYPLRWHDVEPLAAGRPAVRRWTGGGIVEHGDDLTLALAVPATGTPMAPLVFYERVHRAIAEALGPAIHLATPADCSCGPVCFENPARFDVLQGDRKVAGGAIRRCREGTLYQGSLQAVEMPPDFIPRLVRNLACESFEWKPTSRFHELSRFLRTTRYTSRDWLTKR